MLLLQPGDRNDDVAEIRQILAERGLIRNVDPLTANLYDESVDLAVRAFQQHRGLSADGVVDAETRSALNAARWRLGDRVLSQDEGQGLVGDDIADLQSQLLDMGYRIERADGRFGPATVAALRSFQRDTGLVVDGVCGGDTLQALRQLARRVVGGSPGKLRGWVAVSDAGPSLLGKRIVIDPGHGGSDPGQSVAGYCEAEIVFDLSCRLQARLSALGVEAILTRDRDVNLDDAQRAQFANDQGADLVLSLHVDSWSNSLANGVATFYYGAGQSYSSVGERFADLVQREVVARTGMQDDRIHPKSWTLLLLTSMPTVRVELGYLSSPLDRPKLIDPDFSENVAEALSVAIQRLYLPREEDPTTGVLRLPALAT